MRLFFWPHEPHGSMTDSLQLKFNARDSWRFLSFVRAHLNCLQSEEKMLIKLLLLEEIYEEEAIIEHSIKICNTKKIHNLFLTRKIERFYSIIIEKHLFEDEEIFREFSKNKTIKI
ncbi:uncharacterized protein LOC112682598 [Sipha flava]|uniref:Uncharacterized protein LOC112682598 n=1 Tax=Sipha flava TaxID=143950 RepID=A0A8B8FE48_9HEMI|nr:uncharacterized protein LOC112682598 [Sipha flava]